MKGKGNLFNTIQQRKQQWGYSDSNMIQLINYGWLLIQRLYYPTYIGDIIIHDLERPWKTNQHNGMTVLNSAHQKLLFKSSRNTGISSEKNNWNLGIQTQLWIFEVPNLPDHSKWAYVPPMILSVQLCVSNHEHQGATCDMRLARGYAMIHERKQISSVIIRISKE